MAFKFYKNFLEIFEEVVKENEEKIAFKSLENEISYKSLMDKSKRIGSLIAKYNKKNSAIIVYLEKEVNSVVAMLSSIYSGNYYVVIDPSMPKDRIKMIIDTINPFLVITKNDFYDQAIDCFSNIDVLDFEKIVNNEIDAVTLNAIRSKMISTDPIFTIFTSGSSGVPKGAIINHQNLISYISWFINEFNITNKTIFGSQTPFYFSMSVSDMFGTLSTGATFIIIPKVYFSFPIKLVEMMNEYKVNAIYWVPSALAIVANLKVFEYDKPKYLEKVLFAGESMPTKKLNYWMKHIDCYYANLFGPTETVDICTFYHVNRTLNDDESVPIGKACNNVEALIIDENNNLVTEKNKIGELVIRSPFVGMGYYNNKEKTEAAFVNNPLNDSYHEYVYKTGDLVLENDLGELIYAGRKDYQIKHMGYRIELGEIETQANTIDKIKACVCLYDKESDLIIMIYEGRIEIDEIKNELSKKVPDYMIPNKYIRLKQMVYNLNGKIDRAYLNAHYKEL